ncbi:hypothetical protein C8F01DRAFT_274983, partial [Mycena amicta]
SFPSSRPICSPYLLLYSHSLCSLPCHPPCHGHPHICPNTPSRSGHSPLILYTPFLRFCPHHPCFQSLRCPLRPTSSSFASASAFALSLSRPVLLASSLLPISRLWLLVHPSSTPLLPCRFATSHPHGTHILTMMPMSMAIRRWAPILHRVTIAHCLRRVLIRRRHRRSRTLVTFLILSTLPFFTSMLPPLPNADAASYRPIAVPPCNLHAPPYLARPHPDAHRRRSARCRLCPPANRRHRHRQRRWHEAYGGPEEEIHWTMKKETKRHKGLDDGRWR